MWLNCKLRALRSSKCKLTIDSVTRQGWCSHGRWPRKVLFYILKMVARPLARPHDVSQYCFTKACLNQISAQPIAMFGCLGPLSSWHCVEWIVSVDLLPGADVFGRTMLHSRRFGSSGSPCAFKTCCNWVLVGDTHTSSHCN